MSSISNAPNIIPPPPPSECGDGGLDSGLNSPVATDLATQQSSNEGLENGGKEATSNGCLINDSNADNDSNTNNLDANGDISAPSNNLQSNGNQTKSSNALSASQATVASSVNSSSTVSQSSSKNTTVSKNNATNTSTATNASSAAAFFTKVLYYFDDVETPYLIKVPSSSDPSSEEPSVSLGAFKTVVNKANCKYFVKTMDQELKQTVKEEVMDDNALLPLYNGRIIVYVNSIENSSSHGGGGGSQSGGALSGGENNHHIGGGGGASHNNRLSSGAGSGHAGSLGGGLQHGGGNTGSDTGSQYNEIITDHWNTMRTPVPPSGNTGGASRQQQQSQYHKNLPSHGGSKNNRYPAPPPPDEDDYTTATDTESFIQHPPRPGFRGPPPSAVGRYGQNSRNNYMHYNVDVVGGGPGGIGYESGATSQFTTDYDSFMESTTDDDESIYRMGGGYYRHPNGKMMMMPPPGRHPNRRPQRRRPKPGHAGARAAAPSMSSITDSCSSLNLQTVTINMDSSKHLGISIVGQSTNDGAGDGGIYVGEITRDGAVAQEGSITPGDLIIQANDVPFTNMSNDDAVKVLRDLAKKPGPLKLVVAKLWNSDPAGFDGDCGFSPEYYVVEPRTDLPLRPIDPGKWADEAWKYLKEGGHLSPAITSDEGSEVGGVGGVKLNYPNNSTLTSTGMNCNTNLNDVISSGGGGGGVGINRNQTIGGPPGQNQGGGPGSGSGTGGAGGGSGSAPELREYNGSNNAQMQPHLMGGNINSAMSAHSSNTGYPTGTTVTGMTPYVGLRTTTDPAILLGAMIMPNSGLEIKDRMWLKITIPNAFLGRHFVQWLFDKVAGFSSRNEARTFAKKLLREGYLKHTTGKSTFSEQCYYVFNLDRINLSAANQSAVATSNAMYGVGTISTMQSTLDSSQFGGSGNRNMGGGPGGGGVGMIDTTTDNNSSHDGSDDNNPDQLAPLQSTQYGGGALPTHYHAQPQQWNLVPPQYTGYTPPTAPQSITPTSLRYNVGQMSMFSASQNQDFNNPSQMLYTSNMTPLHQQLQHPGSSQLPPPIPPHFSHQNGSSNNSNLSESRMPLMQHQQMMSNNQSPGGPQTQIRKEFNSTSIVGNHGANDSVFANVM